MALQKDYNLTVSYKPGLMNIADTYKNILTSVQLVELSNTIDKTFTIQNAYYKIENLTGDKNKINITVSIYKDNNKTVLFDRKSYSFIPNVTDIAKNFIKQGYEYLKTLDEYENAINLLDEGQTA